MGIYIKLKMLFYFVISQIKYKILMRKFGIKSRIINPMLITNYKNIEIGDDVFIRDGLRLEVVNPENSGVVISIGNNVNIEQNVHIVAHNRIVIGNNVSITGGCSIVDIEHPYDDIYSETKIGSRISEIEKNVIIGDDSFIGFGTHINPGVSIGKYCIIGARSVVTKDIPDYCVAAGNPAKIIKKYDFELKEWIKV
ncbi:acyltransferase [Photobacterium damselae]|uniref:acyltransferase n=1 Tax=Photobacterium damselae TaxID=38293 RepID=UPI000D9AC76B|nr:acyltransferase [Photobacterium damselae]NVO72604.1 acyltransferase [Photobacterium damselae subsp. damselae]SPY22978.1 Putative acetyltransferase SA2342 [Photobacterium damselae]